MTKKRVSQQITTKERAPNWLWVGAYLHTLRTTGSKTEAARVAGIDRTTAYQAAARWPWFQAAITKALADWEEARVELLEAEADRRAAEGVITDVKEVKVDGKKLPLVIRRYSDQLLMFRLKALRKDKYQESVEVVTLTAIEKAIQRLNRELETMDDDEPPGKGIQASETPRAEGATTSEGPAQSPERP